eukprot:s363_g36.t1
MNLSAGLLDSPLGTGLKQLQRVCQGHRPKCYMPNMPTQTLNYWLFSYARIEPHGATHTAGCSNGLDTSPRSDGVMSFQPPCGLPVAVLVNGDEIRDSQHNARYATGLETQTGSATGNEKIARRIFPHRPLRWSCSSFGGPGALKKRQKHFGDPTLNWAVVKLWCQISLFLKLAISTPHPQFSLHQWQDHPHPH